MKHNPLYFSASFSRAGDWSLSGSANPTELPAVLDASSVTNASFSRAGDWSLSGSANPTELPAVLDASSVTNASRLRQKSR
jgi:hypothetical protein